MLEVDIYLKRPATLHLAIKEQLLMLMEKFYIVLILATLPPITQVVVVYCQLSHVLLVQLTKMFMVIR